MSWPGVPPSAQPIRPGGSGPPAGLVVAGLLVVLIGAVAISQLWPKGRSLMANGPTVPATASGPASVSPTPAGATEPSSPPPASPGGQPTASPELEPTVPPLTPLPNLPVAAWSAEIERRVPIPEAFLQASVAVWGPRVYLLDGDGRLLIADLQTETSRTVVLPVLLAEGAVSIAVDGDVVAVVTVRQKGASGPPDSLCHAAGTSMSWRVLIAHLDAAGLPSEPFLSLVEGTARRDFTYPLGPPCTGPWAPLAAVAGDKVFVAQEAPTNARPWASTIGIYDLGAAENAGVSGVAGDAGVSGALGLSRPAEATPRAVGSLAVSGVVVSLSAVPSLTVWVATTGDPPGPDGDEPAPTWNVGYALGGSTVASTVAGAAGPDQGWFPLPSAAADDGIIWWSAVPGHLGLGQINPGALQETFVAGDSPGATVPAEGLSAFDCKLTGASSGRALASCRDPSEPTGQAYVPVVAGGGQAFQITDGSVTTPHIGGGWLAWSDLTRESSGIDLLTGLSLTPVAFGPGS